MRVTNEQGVPISLVLDLWSLGHSGTDIAARLAIRGGRKTVEKIIAKARSVGDRRAVVHETGGRLLGKRRTAPGCFKVVPLILKAQRDR